ncbi:hypothetical protein EDC30_11723 [Paucimonas lemoignei]|uniref:Uncharacterized protein n=2 Tax=Paucimonas lemoignei TaxID=29443 RepID=A0A4R3HPB3_PAULE|nr:hypothetical protein EDC30_11723 [Paucimonas lemoignei]
MEAFGFSRIPSALLIALMLAQPVWAQQDGKQESDTKTQSVQANSDSPEPAPSSAAHSVPAMTERYPKGSINSDELAEQAQVDARSLRTVLATELANAKSACYDRFFTNSCIDKAQEEYRGAIAALKPIELEAGAFQRQSRVDKRDQALAERRKQEEAEAPDRLRIAQENEQKAAEKAQSRAQQEAERQARQASDEKRLANPNERIQRHEEKLQRLREDDARKEQEIPGNIAAYEKKQKEAAERQKKVAERKAKKQAEQEAKQSKPTEPAAK